MTTFKSSYIILLVLLGISSVNYAQNADQREVLKRMHDTEEAKYKENITRTLRLAKRNKWPLVLDNNEQHQVSVLTGIDDWGFPIYTTTFGNISATTISTDKVWQQYLLSGSSANMLGKLAIWDGGTVNKTHKELIGRIIQKDSIGSMHDHDDHATHTTGTMIATGINPSAKGMAYGTKKLIAYDFNNDYAEVSGEAANLLVSNHSYGTNTGWYKDGSTWIFYGNPDSLEDYKFGFYSKEAQGWDSVLYNAPNYLIVQAAGNFRNLNGPAVGASFQYYSASNQTIELTGIRTAGMSSNDSFNTIPTYGNAKNILTVGAVSGLTNGYTKPSDIIMSNFSSWGPTDDGRIKPDLVADGVGVLSTINNSNNAYAVYNGTSMAAPSVTSSLYLLQELYSNNHGGSFMKSASLKAIAIHNTDEAGAAPGPDYKFGWGLMNTKKSADFIANKYHSDTIIEHTLNNSDTYTFNFVASGLDNVKATLVWTDAPADVDINFRLNNPATKLINDLDVKVISKGRSYYPWVLNPKQPTQAAFKGVNNLDNVERVDIDTTITGNLYMVIVTHKGTLQRGSQAFSLIVSGVNGDSACASYPLSNAGLTIDSIAIGNFQYKNQQGCTSYTDNRSSVASIEPRSTIPFYIRLGNCGGSTGANTVVKLYVDYNHNGSYNDAGELVATSNVIVSNNSFTGNFLTPYLPIGSKTTMRIVAVETNDTATVHPCGTYSNGETNDFTVQVAIPQNDIAVTDIVAPIDSACNGSSLIAAQLVNKGTGVLTAIPLSLIVKNGSTVISSQNVTCNAVVRSGDVFSFTFPTPIVLSTSTSYTISVTTHLGNDQDTGNNSLSKTIVTAAGVATPSGYGEICTTNNFAILKVNNGDAAVSYFWYDSPLSDQPIASGKDANSMVIPANNTYYLGSGLNTNSIGLSSKNLVAGGSYSSMPGINHYYRYVSNTDVVLQSTKIFTGYPGKITISAGDIVSGNLLVSSSVDINVPATLPTPVKGTYAVNDPADTGAIYAINLPMRAGTHYLVITTDSNATVFGNNNLPSGITYPMGDQNVLALLSNGVSTTSYFGLYSMKLTSTDCPSAKVAVVVNNSPAPVISLLHDTLFSSYPSNNQWYKDGSMLQFENSNYLVVTDSALYTVSARDAMGCNQTSNGFLYDPTLLYLDTTTKVRDSVYAFAIYPNPVANNLLGIKFSLKGKSDVKVQIMNPLGQLCLLKEYPSFTGNFDQKIWVGNLHSGVYYLTVQLRSNTIKKGVIFIGK